MSAHIVRKAPDCSVDVLRAHVRAMARQIAARARDDLRSVEAHIGPHQQAAQGRGRLHRRMAQRVVHGQIAEVQKLRGQGAHVRRLAGRGVTLTGNPPAGRRVSRHTGSTL